MSRPTRERETDLRVRERDSERLNGSVFCKLDERERIEECASKCSRRTTHANGFRFKAYQHFSKNRFLINRQRSHLFNLLLLLKSHKLIYHLKYKVKIILVSNTFTLSMTYELR
jgi:hypothetical protein